MLSKAVDRVGLRLYAGLVFVAGSALVRPVLAQGEASVAATDPTLWHYIVACVLLGLLAMLFVLVFNWMQRLEKTSYMGQIYSDTLLDLEYNRRKGRADKLMREGEFERRASKEFRDRYEKVLAAEPERPGVLKQYQRPRAGRSDRPGGGQDGYTSLSSSSTSPPGLGDSWGTGDGEWIHDLDVDSMTPEHKELYERYLTSRAKFAQDLDAVTRDRNRRIDLLYEEELEDASKQAAKAAKREADVDIGVFKGRGPSFVLQFTAIVVIVFLAVLLGVLGVLEDQQIGTLLAAIAGYVLGRSTSDGAQTGREPKGADGKAPGGTEKDRRQLHENGEPA